MCITCTICTDRFNMGLFQYKMLDGAGEVRKGTAALPFDDRVMAMRYLERQGGTVLAIAPVNILQQLVYALSASVGRISRKELAEMLNNLSMLLRAGVPIRSALQEIQEATDNKALSKRLRFIRTDIEGGQTFSEALSRQSGLFSSLVLNMCRIGEETGRLDAMLKKSSEHLLHIEQICSSTRRGLLYPCFLLLVVTAAAVFWFLYVVPGLVTLFQDMGLQLPWITQVVLRISELFQGYFFQATGLMVLFAVLLWQGRRHFPRMRYAQDALLLRLPLIKNVIQTAAVARICENLGILIGAGIGILRTLEIVAESVGNDVYRTRLLRVGETIQGGATLAGGLRQTRAVHPFAIRMIAVGEQSGRLEEQTRYVAEVYRERLVGLVDVLSKSLEPVLLVGLGVVFAMLIGGLLLPVYDLLGQLQ